MTKTALIEISAGCLQYRDDSLPILSQMNISIPKHGWTCLLGKSGCGKTTLLRFLAGLLDEKVNWHGRVETSLSGPIAENVAYMAQDDLLLPWLNIIDNVCLSFTLTEGKIRSDVELRAKQLLHQVGLADYGHYYPNQLSGGMRQRVALARTLIQDKPLILMDEPFSALDAITRTQLQNLSFSLLKEKSVVLITHDPQEALRLGNEIYLLRGKPAHVSTFDLPKDKAPRAFTQQLAQMQQTLVNQLGGHG